MVDGQFPGTVSMETPHFLAPLVGEGDGLLGSTLVSSHDSQTKWDLITMPISLVKIEISRLKAKAMVAKSAG